MEKPFVQAVLESSMVALRLPDGMLMGCLTHPFDRVAHAAACYSKDNGRTWSEPESLFSLPEGTGEWGLCEALVDRDCSVHLFFLQVPSGPLATAGEAEKGALMGEMLKSRIDVWHAKSDRGRQDWLQPRRIWKGYTGALNSVIQLASGRIVLPFSFMTSRSWQKRGQGLDEFTFMGSFDSTAVYSDDAGSTWQLSNSIRVAVPDISYAYGAVEPVVLQLRDGRVWMLIRTQMGRFYESFSEDGAVWSKPRPSRILSSDSPAGLVRLEDGRIVLFWNHCLRFPYAYGGRQVLHAAISEDEGRTWRGYREVARDPKRNEPPPPNGDFGTAYPFPALSNDGKVIYCTGQGKGRVLLVQLDPDWLLEKAQESDFRERPEEWSVFGTRGVEFLTHPGNPGAKVLSLRKTDADWPASAVWNFPAGRSGSLWLRLWLRQGFHGALVGLTDHFSPPFDEEDLFNNVWNIQVDADLRLSTGAQAKPNQWHDLMLRWDCAERNARIELDGQPAGAAPQLRSTTGICYLRLRSTAETTDAGFLVETVKVEVS